ncbi:MAG: DUF411 domain-containing protein [Methylococcaceae bacterium]|nr:DUF411 domain-containing protein [Methylococcaceae bacterium]
MNRLIPLLLLTLGLALPLQAVPVKAAKDTPIPITVHRSPTCSCCGKWMEHMKHNGFAVAEIRAEDMDAIKRQHGVPETLKSCHTALVGGYVVEGHVPAEDVKSMLNSKPTAIGISAPGMPVGSPGMEMGAKNDPYTVVQFDKSGNATVFHDYAGQ